MSRSGLLACALLVLVLTAQASAKQKKVPKACKKYFKTYSELSDFAKSVQSDCPIDLAGLRLLSCPDDCRATISQVSLSCVKAAGKPYGKSIVKALERGYKQCS